MIRPLCETATTVEECAETFAHLCAALTHADGEMRDLIREDIDRIIDRANELRQR